MHAQAPGWLWAVSGGGSQVEYSKSVATDIDGNVYITGSFEGTAQFSGVTLASRGLADVFIAKYDSSGALQWIRQGGGSQLDEGLSIAADAFGNCYVSGAFRDTAIFDSDTVFTTNTLEMFFACYDSTGTLSWLKKVGNRSYGGSVTTDNHGHVFITGRFQGTGIFDTISLVAFGGTDVFLAKFDSSGAVQWAQKGGGTSSDQCFGSSTDAYGNTYLTGEFGGIATFGSLQLSSSPPPFVNIFMVKYDPNGNALWVNHGSSTDVIYAYSIGADPAGNCFASGLFRDSALFDTLSLINPSASALNVYLVRFDTAGHATWASRAYASNIIDSRSLAVDANGDCYLSGFFAGTASFGALSINSTLGFADAFVTKYDSGGSVEWIQKGGGNASESDGAIGLDAQGNAYVTGRYSASTSVFGTDTLPFPGASNMFLAKLGSTLVTGLPAVNDMVQIRLFPNPAGEWITLSGLDRTFDTIELYNTIGEKVAEINCSPGELQRLHIISLTPGLYVVNDTDKEMTATGKFIRQD